MANDFCVVCQKLFTRKSKRQRTCLSSECVTAWKDGISKTPKPKYECLNCGKESPRRLCAKCRKRGESIQQWSSWEGIRHEEDERN